MTDTVIEVVDQGPQGPAVDLTSALARITTLEALVTSLEARVLALENP